MPSWGRWILAAVLATSSLSAVFADEMDSRPVRAHRHHHHHYLGYLPRERHVIEVVSGAYGYSFVINGANFRAKTTASCGGWLAGDRIKLLAGSWHAACVDAVFYNATRHRSCEMWCG
jgi:hypothetical protein